MSESKDVPADSNIVSEKEVSDDGATSSVAQTCVNAAKTDNVIKTASEVTYVSDNNDSVSAEEALSQSEGTARSAEQPSSTVTDDVRNESSESILSGDVEPLSFSPHDRAPHHSAGADRTEVSEDESEYKDAEVSKRGHDLSDSESQAGSETSSEGVRTGRRNRRHSNDVEKNNYSDDESIEKEDPEDEPHGTRESGDGEEKTKDKVVDRDEDKKDPQYIPKKGVFYEHDDRTADSGPANTAEEPKDTKKKKVVADKIDRWGHDMFDNVKQSPKTTQDLIDYYGYDIRNEEEPPKAWRSRRYGRGPNKYTRQWQDEAAYRNKRPQTNKPPAPTAFKNNIDDFPTVEQSKSGYRRSKNRNMNNSREGGNRERGRTSNKSLSPKDYKSDVRRKLPSDTSPNMPSANMQPQQEEADVSTSPKENKYKDIQIEKTVFLNKKKPFSSAKTKSEAEAEADLAALSKEFSNAVINLGRDGKILPIRPQNNNVNPPSNLQRIERESLKEIRSESHPGVQHTSSSGGEARIKERRDTTNQGAVSSSKSKRYSTQRQRSLPQSNHLQQQQQPQQGPPQQQQQFLHQQQFYPPPPPPQTAPETVPDSALFSGFQGNPPPVYTDSMQNVVFLPGYPPTPPPHILNYCPAPQQFGIPPPLGPPPPEMFPAQPPPGITYYSPQNQVQPRPPASRRVKVAIPIVAPPDQQAQSDQTCS